MYRDSNSGTILVLGILSIVMLPILGPIAWVMGNNSLKAIDMGMTNPADRSNVNAGRVCGIIGSIILVMASVILAIYIAFGMTMLRVVTKMTQDADSAPPAVTVSHKQRPTSASLSSAIINGDKKAFDALLAKDPSLANKPNNVGETPLFDAAFAGRKEMAKSLIDHGANVNATDDFGKTPLDQAKFFHKNDIVELLESHGAKPGKRQ